MAGDGFSVKFGETMLGTTSDVSIEEYCMPSPILKYFKFDHLPKHLQDVSMPLAMLAATVDETLPDGPEKSAGLRKLLEAKDCFVRAALG